MRRMLNMEEIWKGGISTVLHGKQKTAGGYIWKFKEDYENEENKN